MLPPNILNPYCPSRQVLELLANKWTLLIVRVLSQGTRRYGEIRREAGGITQKMLTQTLKELEQNGIIKRVVYPVSPPKVEYSLTRLGESLIQPLNAICLWAEQHYAEIADAREAYQVSSS
jgi:DNA-binding HxlR family transcriptional regulator